MRCLSDHVHLGSFELFVFGCCIFFQIWGFFRRCFPGQTFSAIPCVRSFGDSHNLNVGLFDGIPETLDTVYILLSSFSFVFSGPTEIFQRPVFMIRYSVSAGSSLLLWFEAVFYICFTSFISVCCSVFFSLLSYSFISCIGFQVHLVVHPLLSLSGILSISRFVV